MKIIDLSITTENDLPCDPPSTIPKITYLTHKDSAEMMADAYQCELEDINGFGWGTELVSFTTHSGTHLDAPWHFYPTMNNGEPAMTIDHMPLEWCIGDGVILDFSHKGDAYKLTVADFQEKLAELSYTLKPLDIVFIQSGAADRWGKEEYLVAGCGVSREATLWLAAQGVHIMGTDGWSWDIPLPIAARQYKETGDKSLLWEAHRAGAHCVYGHIEKLTNLENVPPLGSTIVCLPIKVKGASAGWTRAIAIVDGPNFRK